MEVDHSFDSLVPKEPQFDLDGQILEEERVCRICFAAHARFETPFEADLIAPCDCKGSTKWVHRACLNQWRRVNRGRRKSFECEICKGKYAILVMKPSFWQYIKVNWSPVEKMIYSTAAFTVFLSALTSLSAFFRERRRRPTFVKNLSLVEKIFHFYLFGWPVRSKMTMYLCMAFIIWGNSVLFENWRDSNSFSLVLDRSEIDKLHRKRALRHSYNHADLTSFFGSNMRRGLLDIDAD